MMQVATGAGPEALSGGAALAEHRRGERLATWDLADNVQTAASWTRSLDRTM